MALLSTTTVCFKQLKKHNSHTALEINNIRMQISTQQFLNSEALSYMDASAQHERKMNVTWIMEDWRLRETGVLTLIKISFRN